jgi:hypothetical protein
MSAYAGKQQQAINPDLFVAIDTTLKKDSTSEQSDSK